MATTQAEWNKVTAQEKAARTKLKNERAKEQATKTTDKKVLALNQEKARIRREQIDTALLAIDNLNIENIPLIRNYNDYVAAHKNDSGYPTSSNLAALQLLSQPVNHNFDLIKGYMNRIDKAEALIKQLDTQIAKITKTNTDTSKTKVYVGNPNLKNVAPKGEKIQFSRDYKYNAPMVSSAYFGSNSLENTILEGNRVDQGKFEDARQAWKNVTGGRGTIQMDQRFLNGFTKNQTTTSKVKFDTQKYGFKFLYNPQTVSMAWGLMSAMDPYYEAQQMDKFQVVATSLMSSTVSFQLMLNRIKDFDYLDNAINPYPEFVAPEERDQIWAKGTMYDLEYLFKTINGPDGTFESQLNGTTADRGWMRPTIVELHLGYSMRYRVRISEFAVNHIIFNSRMVPMLSTVNITCNRFNDGPEAVTSTAPTGKARSGGSGKPGAVL